MEAAKLKTERRARPALDGGTAFVAARVSRFLKHPSGHTVYECEVELPSSRQVSVSDAFSSTCTIASALRERPEREGSS